MERVSVFAPKVIDDSDTTRINLVSTGLLGFSSEPGRKSSSTSTAPLQQYAGDSVIATASVKFDEVQANVYDVWATWQEYSHLGSGTYTLAVSDDVTRQTLSPFKSLSKDEQTGFLRRSSEFLQGDEERIVVNFYEPPNTGGNAGYVHSDGLPWFPIATVKLDPHSILKVRLENQVNGVRSGQIPVDGFKLTPHVSREVMAYDHANRLVESKLYTESLTTASVVSTFAYDVMGRQVVSSSNVVRTSAVTTTGVGYEGQLPVVRFDMKAATAGNIESFTLFDQQGAVIASDTSTTAQQPVIGHQLTTWQINNLDGSEFTNTETWFVTPYAFAGNRRVTVNSDPITQMQQSNRDMELHNWNYQGESRNWLSRDAMNRLGGGVQLASGLVQAGFSIGAGVVSCPASVGAGCVAGVVGTLIGVDNAVAGFQTLMTGEDHATVLNMAVRAGASQFMSKENAARLATGVELAAGFGSGVADDFVRASSKFALAGNSAVQASRLAMQHASRAAKYQLGGAAVGAAVGYGVTGDIDGALMGASFGQMGGSLAAHFAVSCFTAGTPLVVDLEGNSRPIEEINVGEFVLARSEFDPEGPLELKRVEEKFVRTAVVMELVIEGQSIKTTAEHPFYVPARQAFVPAGELKAGDKLVSHDGRLIEIASVCSTEAVTTVYNLRVADHHTYFVGGTIWGWDVWVHNASYRIQSLGNTSNGIRGIGVADYLDPTHQTRLKSVIGELSGMDGDHMLPKQAVKNAIAEYRSTGAKVSRDQARQIAIILNGSDNLHLMPSSFNRSKGSLSIAEWISASGLGGQVGRPYAKFVAGQQDLIGRQINAILGGAYIDPKFLNQAI